MCSDTAAPASAPVSAAELALKARPLINAVLAEHRGRLGGRDLDDVRQECFIGLLEAARRFDPSLGYQFSTYAKPWVRKYLLDWLRDGERTIRLPAELYRRRAALRSYLEAGNALREVTALLGLPPERARAALGAATVVESLDQPLPGSDATREGPDPGPGPDDEIIARQDTRTVGRALASLQPDERILLIRWYGLGGAAPTALSDLARDLGVARHVLRERGATALAKLQHPCIRATLDSTP